jgi:hypothetical protein
MSTSDPQLVGPYEQLHRKLSSLEIRFVRNLTKNPWRAEDLVFEPWDELHGPEYDVEFQPYIPLETMLGMLQARNAHLFESTQMLEVIKDGNTGRDQSQHCIPVPGVQRSHSPGPGAGE